MKTKILILFLNGLIPMLLYAQNIDWFQKGLDTRDTKKQIEFFTKSIEQGSDLAAAYFCRAGAKLGQGDVQGAIDDFSKCIEIDPEDVGAYLGRALAKQHISIDYQGADADIMKSFELDPTNPSCFNLVNELYLKKKDCPNAIIFYHKVLKDFPDNAVVYCNLGYCYLETQDYSLALEYFSKAISSQTENINAILGITLVYYNSNDMANAKKWLDQAKELKPVLQQGVAGFETFKKAGYRFSDRNNEALKKMLTK